MAYIVLRQVYQHYAPVAGSGTDIAGSADESTKTARFRLYIWPDAQGVLGRFAAALY